MSEKKNYSLENIISISYLSVTNHPEQAHVVIYVHRGSHIFTYFP